MTTAPAPAPPPAEDADTTTLDAFELPPPPSQALTNPHAHLQDTHWLYLAPAFAGGGALAWSGDGLLAAAAGHCAAVLSPAFLDGPRQFAVAVGNSGGGGGESKAEEAEDEEGSPDGTATTPAATRQQQPLLACQPDDPDASAALDLASARRMVGPQRFGGAAASAGGGGGANANATAVDAGGPLPAVRGVAWSPLGADAAAGGGCLLATVSSDHAVRVFRAPPAREGLPAASAKWIEAVELGAALRRALAGEGGWAGARVAAAVSAVPPSGEACPALYDAGGSSGADEAQLMRLRGGGRRGGRQGGGEEAAAPAAAAAAASQPRPKRARTVAAAATKAAPEVKEEEEEKPQQQQKEPVGSKRRRAGGSAGAGPSSPPAAAAAAAAPPPRKAAAAPAPKKGPPPPPQPQPSPSPPPAPPPPEIAAALRSLLTPGSHVEVQNDEEGLVGCWFGARVVAHAPDPLLAVKRGRGRPRKDEAERQAAAREAAALAAAQALAAAAEAAGKSDGKTPKKGTTTTTAAAAGAPATTPKLTKKAAAVLALEPAAGGALVLVEYDELNEREEEGAPKLREWFPLPAELGPYYGWFAAIKQEEQEEQQQQEAKGRGKKKAAAPPPPPPLPPPQSGQHTVWRRPGFQLRPRPPANLSDVAASDVHTLAAPGASLEAFIEGGWWASVGAPAEEAAAAEAGPSAAADASTTTLAVTVWDQPGKVTRVSPEHVRRMLLWDPCPEGGGGASAWKEGKVELLWERQRQQAAAAAAAAAAMRKSPKPSAGRSRKKKQGQATRGDGQEGDGNGPASNSNTDNDDDNEEGQRTPAAQRRRRSPGSGTPDRAFSDDDPEEASYDRQPYVVPDDTDASAIFEALDPGLCALVRGRTRAARAAAPKLVLARWLALREEEVPDPSRRLAYSKGRHLRGKDASRFARAVAELVAAFGSAIGGQEEAAAASSGPGLGRRRRPAPVLLPAAPTPFSSGPPAPRDVAAVPDPDAIADAPGVDLREVCRLAKSHIRREAIQSYDRYVRLRRRGEGGGATVGGEELGEGEGGGGGGGRGRPAGTLVPVDTGMGGRAAPPPPGAGGRSWQGPAGLQGALLRAARRAAAVEAERKRQEEGEGGGEGGEAAAAAAPTPPLDLDAASDALPRGRGPLDTWQGKYMRVSSAAEDAAAAEPSLRVGFVAVSARPAANARRPLRLGPSDEDALAQARGAQQHQQPSQQQQPTARRARLQRAPAAVSESTDEDGDEDADEAAAGAAAAPVPAVPSALYDARRGFLEPLCVSWSPAISDGAGRRCYLATGTRSGHVHFWRLALPTAAGLADTAAPPTTPSLSPRSFAYAGCLRAHAGYVTALAFAAVSGAVAGPVAEAAAGEGDAVALATGASDGDVRLWVLRPTPGADESAAVSGQDATTLPQPPFACVGAAVPADGRPVTALDATVAALRGGDGDEEEDDDDDDDESKPPRLKLLVAAAKTLGTVALWSSGAFSAGRQQQQQQQQQQPIAPLLLAACSGGSVSVRPRAHGLGPATGAVIDPHEGLLHTSGADGIVRCWPITGLAASSKPAAAGDPLPAAPSPHPPARYNARSRGAHVPTSLREAQVQRCPVVGLASPPLSRLALAALRDISSGASTATADATGSGRMSFARIAFATVHLLTPFGEGAAGDGAAGASSSSPVGRALQARDVARRAPSLTSGPGGGGGGPGALPGAFWDVGAAVSRAGWARLRQAATTEDENDQQKQQQPMMTGEERRAAAAARRAVAEARAVGALALACADALERPFARRRAQFPPAAANSDSLYSSCTVSDWRGLQLGAALRRSALALMSRRPLAGGGLPPGAAEAVERDAAVRAARAGLARGLGEAEMELVQRRVRDLLEGAPERFSEALASQQQGGGAATAATAAPAQLQLTSPAAEALCDRDPRAASALLAADWVALAARHPGLRAHALLPRAARLYAAARLAPPLPPVAAAPPGRERNPLLPPPPPLKEDDGGEHEAMDVDEDQTVLPRVAMSGGAVQAASTAAVACGAYAVKGEDEAGGGEEDEQAPPPPIVLPMPRCAASLRVLPADAPCARCVVCGRHYEAVSGLPEACAVCGLRLAAPPAAGAGACAGGGAAQALEAPAARVLPSAVFLPTLGA